MLFQRIAKKPAPAEKNVRGRGDPLDCRENPQAFAGGVIQRYVRGFGTQRAAFLGFAAFTAQHARGTAFSRHRPPY